MVLSVTILVAGKILMLEENDMFTMRVSKAELVVMSFSFYRLSIVAILMGLTSAGDADVGFLIKDGTYIIAYIMYAHIALIVMTCVMGIYLISHAHSDNVAGKRRHSRLQKAAASSIKDNGDDPPAMGSAMLNMMV